MLQCCTLPPRWLCCIRRSILYWLLSASVASNLVANVVPYRQIFHSQYTTSPAPMMLADGHEAFFLVACIVDELRVLLYGCVRKAGEAADQPLQRINGRKW